MRGPYLSTNQPSMGTSQVSVRMKMEKATWMAGAFPAVALLHGVDEEGPPVLQVSDHAHADHPEQELEPPVAWAVCPSWRLTWYQTSCDIASLLSPSPMPGSALRRGVVADVAWPARPLGRVDLLCGHLELAHPRAPEAVDGGDAVGVEVEHVAQDLVGVLAEQG